MLGAAGHLRFDAGGDQPIVDVIDHLGQVDVALGRPGGHHLLDLRVAPGMEGGEGQVLELPLDVLDSEAVGQRGVDVEGLLGAALLLPLGHGRDGLHVVEPVGQLDQQDPGILGHGHQHLAHGGRLLGLAGVEADPVQLGDAVDDGRHVGPELRLDLRQAEAGVLDRVVEQGGRDGDVVEAQPGQDGGHRQRVGDVGLAGVAELAMVGGGRRLVGPDDHAGLVARVPGPEGAEQRTEGVGGLDLPSPGQHPFDGGHRPVRPIPSLRFITASDSSPEGAHS